MPIAARLPIHVATREESTAITRLFSKAFHRSSDSKNNFSYQMRLNPSKFALFAELNEKSVITISGRNRKATESANVDLLKLKNE